MAKPLRLGVAYDFRNPPEFGLSHQALYAAIMEQVAWLDGLGLDLVWFTEHHFVDDGYLPSWIPSRRRWRRDQACALLVRCLPAALQPSAAARRGSCGARQYQRRARGDRRRHGLRAARVPGFRPAGVASRLADRRGARRADPRLHRRVFSYGQALPLRGREDHAGIRAAGWPPLWVAAMSRRAPCERRGSAPTCCRRVRADSRSIRGRRSSRRRPRSGDHRIGIIRSCLVTDDRERDWAQVRVAGVDAWRSTTLPRGSRRTWRRRRHRRGRAHPADLGGRRRRPLVTELAAFIHEYGLTDIVTWAVPPGMHARRPQMSPSLERFARDVAPRLRAMFGSGP